jgi:hypothetical protein
VKKQNVVGCRTHVVPMQKQRGYDKFIAAGADFSDVVGVVPIKSNFIFSLIGLYIFLSEINI